MKRIFKKILFYLTLPIWATIAAFNDNFMFFLIDKGWFN